jgi:hypothetical protein
MSFKYLRVLFVVALVILLAIQFSPVLLPEIFPDTSNKINEMISRLCYAYIGSFIFYYLVVHLKRKKDEANISEFVSNNIKYLYYNYKYLMNSMQKNSENKIEFPNAEQLKNILGSIDPNSEAPLVMGVHHRKADWFDLLDHVFDRHHIYLKKLETLVPHLPTRLVRILARADFKTTSTVNYVWFRTWQTVNKKKYKSLEFAAGTLASYVESINLFKGYHEELYGTMDVKRES